MWIDLYHLTVLFGCMALLMTLVIRGKSIFVIAPLCALLAATLSGVDPLVQMNEAYMTGFADYVKRFYLMFALGAVFGKLMDQSGAAVTIAQAVGHRLGTERRFTLVKCMPHCTTILVSIHSPFTCKIFRAGPTIWWMAGRRCRNWFNDRVFSTTAILV